MRARQSSNVVDAGRLREAALAPWKVANELRRWALLPFAVLYFELHGVAWGKGWRIFGLPLIQRRRDSGIRIGRNLEMRNWFASNPLGVHHRTILATWSPRGCINIGDDVEMTGATLCAASQIQIGDRVLIGANSTIVDTDFHPLDAATRQLRPSAGRTSPIVVGDDVFVGMSAMILKGSRIGSRSVIGAGSVVSGDVPEGVVVAGNPARIVREI